MGTPIHCRVRVDGQLGPGWAGWFAGLAIEPRADGSTELVGEVPDQAALFGVLIAVRDVGLALLRVETRPGRDGAGRGRRATRPRG